MDSIFSILPMGLFGHNPSMEVAQIDGSASSPSAGKEESGRKRPRDSVLINTSGNGSTTPTLISRRSSEVPSFREEDDLQPFKRFRGASGHSLPPPIVEVAKVDAAPDRLSLLGLPEDVLAHCLSFLTATGDRFALQCTSRQFRRISNSDEMMIGIQVGGDCTTGLNGIILDDDTPDTAADKLMPFAMSGNLEAVYM